MVVKYGDVVVNDTKVLFICHSSMERVELAHYTATESDSPVQTLEELCAVPTSDSAEVSALSFSTPVAQFQCIEHPELFLWRHPVKCHIKPRCMFKELINNDNNLFAMSREFHDFFDGMMTIDQKSGEEDIPLFVIKPPEKRDFKEELVGVIRSPSPPTFVTPEVRTPHQTCMIQPPGTGTPH